MPHTIAVCAIRLRPPPTLKRGFGPNTDAMKYDRTLPPAKLLVSILFSAAILGGAFLVLSPFMLAIIWAAILAVASTRTRKVCPPSQNP